MTWDAIPELAAIHNRLPVVVVNKGDFDTWLFPDSTRNKLIDVINAETTGFEAGQSLHWSTMLGIMFQKS